MRVLGLSCFYHDAAAALVVDGRIIAAAQEERFSRIKNDASFPQRAIDYCLHEAGIDIADIDSIVFYDKPFLKFERILETYMASAPRGFVSYLHVLPQWIGRKLWMEHAIKKALDWKGEVLFVEHHLSHAASAFFPSPFSRAALLIADGVGEWATTSWGIGNGKVIELKQEILFPHSIGLLYSAFSAHLGFEVNAGEYKVMGLAPYGVARYRDFILENIVDVKEDGSFQLNQEYFDFSSLSNMTTPVFTQHFGSARAQNDTLTQQHTDIAASIQSVTEEVLLRIARNVRIKSGERNLCMAGGVALNAVAIGKIVREKIFDEVWVQPASGDAGGALGAALLGWYKNSHAERIPTTIAYSPFLGPSFETEIAALVATCDAPFTKYDDHEADRRIAELIDQGSVVGIFRGRMEYGPRALGNRSILADARNPDMQKILNERIKFREGFRPFAPAVLDEHTREYFETAGVRSPFMLMTMPVAVPHRIATENTHDLNAMRSDIPSVTHIDFSARLQTVSAEHHPRFYALIKAFYGRTRCPLVINTSFNIKDEPIVCTPLDAYRCFMRTNMDALVLGNYILVKDPHAKPHFQESPTAYRSQKMAAFLEVFFPKVRVKHTQVMIANYSVVGVLLFLSYRWIANGHQEIALISAVVAIILFVIGILTPILMRQTLCFILRISGGVGSIVGYALCVVLYCFYILPVNIWFQLTKVRIKDTSSSYWSTSKVSTLD